MKRIKKIDILSLGYLQGAIGAGIGLVFGAIITFFSLLVGSMGGMMNNAEVGQEMAIGSALFGIAAIIILPVMYGVAGFVSGVFSALIYNFAARFTGGLAIRLEDDVSKTKPHTPDENTS